MTVSRQHLLVALRAVEYPTRKPSSSQVAMVRLRVGSGCLSAETVNESSRFTFGEAPHGERITASYSGLMDAVFNAPEGELKLAEEDSKLLVSCGRFKARVSVEPPDCWVERRCLETINVVTAKSDALAESLRFAIQCAYKEGGRVEFESAILSASSDTLTVGASNGRVIAVSESGCHREGSALIHFKDAAEIVSKLDFSSVASIGSTESSTVVRCGHLCMEFAKPTSFVDVINQWKGKILPSLGVESSSATISKQRLCQAMEYGCSVAGDAIPAVSLRISNGILHVEAVGQNGAMSDEIVALNSSGSSEIALSGKMVPPMLRAMRGDEVKMSVHTQTPGALFSNGSQTLFACAMRAR